MLRLRVKEIAKEKGFSMGKLSRASDVDYNTIKRMYDDRKYSPTVDTLYKVAKVLNVSIAELVEEISDNTQEN
jgi:transcriptional regulator with XRE-family HTH domain